MLGFIHFQSVINLFTFMFFSTKALMFLKKNSFFGRQKSVGAAILFCKFWLYRFLQRLAYQLSIIGFKISGLLTVNKRIRSAIFDLRILSQVFNSCKFILMGRFVYTLDDVWAMNWCEQYPISYRIIFFFQFVILSLDYIPFFFKGF